MEKWEKMLLGACAQWNYFRCSMLNYRQEISVCSPASVPGAASVWPAEYGDSGMARRGQTGSCPCPAHWGASHEHVAGASPSSASRWWCSSRCHGKKTLSTLLTLCSQDNTSTFILCKTINTPRHLKVCNLAHQTNILLSSEVLTDPFFLSLVLWTLFLDIQWIVRKK